MKVVKQLDWAAIKELNNSYDVWQWNVYKMKWVRLSNSACGFTSLEYALPAAQEINDEIQRMLSYPYEPILISKGYAKAYNGQKGLWTVYHKNINIKGYDVEIYIVPKGYDYEKVGLIYTDREFEKSIKQLLRKNGYCTSGVGYSEQGLQGDNYVHMDAGKKITKQIMNRYYKGYKHG